MSRCGNCYANAQAEFFWNRLKIELLDGGSFRNLRQARLESSHYLASYNAEHSGTSPLAISPLTTSKPIFKPCCYSGRRS